ncbi:hypothetical protein KAR91_81995 [Candidatus Pacearchaeota archaeon]|nr:hypothetical protein [Candidatus Pacearchaeota archaeon]
MNQAIVEIKEEQKALAKEIRKSKDDWNSNIYRINHIAYCELRGTPREKIEVFAYDDRKPYNMEGRIQKAKDAYRYRIEEAREDEVIRIDT